MYGTAHVLPTHFSEYINISAVTLLSTKTVSFEKGTISANIINSNTITTIRILRTIPNRIFIA